jgi:hypothetical protein
MTTTPRRQGKPTYLPAYNILTYIQTHRIYTGWHWNSKGRGIVPQSLHQRKLDITDLLGSVGIGISRLCARSQKAPSPKEIWLINFSRLKIQREQYYKNSFYVQLH